MSLIETDEMTLEDLALPPICKTVPRMDVVSEGGEDEADGDATLDEDDDVDNATMMEEMQANWAAEKAKVSFHSLRTGCQDRE